VCVCWASRGTFLSSFFRCDGKRNNSTAEKTRNIAVSSARVDSHEITVLALEIICFRHRTVHSSRFPLSALSSSLSRSRNARPMTSRPCVARHKNVCRFRGYDSLSFVCVLESFLNSFFSSSCALRAAALPE
jgi:hypothetical protein